MSVMNRPFRLIKRFFQNKATQYIYSLYRLRQRFVIAVITFALVSTYLFLTYYLLDQEWFHQVIMEYYNICEYDLDSYIVSQKASALDNSFVILIVSLALSLWKASDPSMETLNKRIAFIFPNIDSSQGLKFIKKHLQKLATISPRTRVTFQIDEWDEKHELMKAEMVYECSISNLHNQNKLSGEDIEFAFELTSDAATALQKKYANAKQIVWGKVSEIRTISPKTSDKWDWHTKGHHMLIDGNGHSTKAFSLDSMMIPPNQEAQLDCIWSFWTFNNGKCFDTFGGFRFTKKLEVFYVNNLDRDFTVEMLILSKHDYSKQTKSYWENSCWEDESKRLNTAQYYDQELKPPCNKGNHVYVGDENSNRVEFKYEDFSNDHLMIWRIKFDS